MSSDSLGQTLDEMWAAQDGVSVAEYRAREKDRQVFMARAETFEQLPPEAWPDLHPNWDLSIDGRRHTLDGPSIRPGQCSETVQLARKTSEGEWCLGWVEGVALRDQLISSLRIEKHELWTKLSAPKLSRVIAHIAQGGALSPPLVGIAPSGDWLTLCGGRHRFTALCAIGHSRIPIYCGPADLDKVEARVSIEWA